MTGKIMQLKDKAIRQIMDLPNIENVITKGEDLPISILPGRTKSIVAPFAKRGADEAIREIRVGVFDLPTVVNAAGDPTKRATFKFEMVAAESKEFSGGGTSPDNGPR